MNPQMNSLTTQPQALDLTTLRTFNAPIDRFILDCLIANQFDYTVLRRRIQKMDAYFRNIGFLSGSDSLTSFFQTTGQRVANSVAEPSASHNQLLNPLQGDVRAFTALLGPKPPAMQVEALDPGNEAQDGATKSVRRALDLAQRYCGWGVLGGLIAQFQALRGTTFVKTYAKTVATATVTTNESSQVPRFQQECPQCGWAAEGPEPYDACPQCNDVNMHTRQGMVSQSNQTVKMTRAVRLINEVHGLDTVIIPTFVKADNWIDIPWLIQEDEPYCGDVWMEYKLIPKIYDTPLIMHQAPRDFVGGHGALVRAALESASGTLFVLGGFDKTRCVRRRLWLAPNSYCMLNHAELQAYLSNPRYAQGARVTIINDHVVEIEPDKLIHRWTGVPPEPMAHVIAQPYFFNYLGAQDQVNTGIEILTSSAERSVGITLFDHSLLSKKLIQEYGGHVGAWLPVTMQSGKLADKIHQLTPSAFPSAYRELISVLIGFKREESGVTETLWGGGQYATAHEAELRNDKALQRLGLSWGQMRMLHAGAQQNSVITLAENYDAILVDRPGVDQGIPLTFAQGLDRMAIKLTPDEGMPITLAAERDVLMKLLVNTPPEVGAKLGVYSPENIRSIWEVLGSTRWVIPGYQSRKMILQFLEQALMKPGDPSLAPQTLSIILNPVEVLGTVREWAQSDSGSEIIMNDPQAFMALSHWLEGWIQLTQPSPMQPNSAPPDSPQQ